MRVLHGKTIEGGLSNEEATHGRTGLLVSEVCLGTMNFGRRMNEADSHECMSKAFNLTQRMLEMEVMPACKDYGVGVIAYGSIGGGMLAGGVIERVEKKLGRVGMNQGFVKKVEANKDAIIAYEKLCKEIGHHPLEVAMSWMAAHPGVCTSVVGPSAVSQLEQYTRGSDLRLDSNVFEKLDQIWPGPGGEAPEAYSWGQKHLPKFSYKN